MMHERPYWSLPALAREWDVTRQTVRYYVNEGLLEAHREDGGSGHAYRVTAYEKDRFERETRPKLRPGPGRHGIALVS
ncbi:MAG: MerR family transcriptional regulator [bacterium]|nr:MerR family transcriptional regulator [bacterium]